MQDLLARLSDIDLVVAMGWIIAVNLTMTLGFVFFGPKVGRILYVHSTCGWGMAMGLYIYAFVYNVTQGGIQ